jgi:hypothetical protein
MGRGLRDGGRGETAVRRRRTGNQDVSRSRSTENVISGSFVHMLPRFGKPRAAEFPPGLHGE